MLTCKDEGDMLHPVEYAYIMFKVFSEMPVFCNVPVSFFFSPLCFSPLLTFSKKTKQKHIL